MPVSLSAPSSGGTVFARIRDEFDLRGSGSCRGRRARRASSCRCSAIWDVSLDLRTRDPLRDHMRVRIAGLFVLLSTASGPALDFTPCTETGHEDFDCSTLGVPLDRTGTMSGTVALAIERLRRDGPPR